MRRRTMKKKRERWSGRFISWPSAANFYNIVAAHLLFFFFAGCGCASMAKGRETVAALALASHLDFSGTGWNRRRPRWPRRTMTFHGEMWTLFHIRGDASQWMNEWVSRLGSIPPPQLIESPQWRATVLHCGLDQVDLDTDDDDNTVCNIGHNFSVYMCHARTSPRVVVIVVVP